MMPSHLANIPLTIVEDNARLPSDELVERVCTYRRRRRSITPVSPVDKPLKIAAKPSRWDAIPVSKTSPKMMPKAQMTLHDCAKMSLRMPRRWLEDTEADKVHQPLKQPIRTREFADTAAILEMALAEVCFTDELSHVFDEQVPKAATI